MDEKLKICIIILIIFFVGFFTRLETVKLKGMNSTEKAYFTDEKGLPYMYEPDSYYNYRLTANILDHGHPGDKIVNGKPWDLHSYYPPGGPVDYPPLILWLSLIFYKFLNLFTTVDLMEACFWLPALIGPLAGIPVFFFVRRYAGNLPGMFAGILVVLAPFYFARTVPGFYDTDMFNISFPVLVAFFFCKAIETDKNHISVVLSSFSLAMFSLAWNGWPYIFYIIILSGILYVISLKLKGGRETISFLKKLTIFIIISMAFILLFGRLHYLSIFQTFFNLVFKSQLAWPSVYESIGELRVPTFDEFLSAAGPLNMGLGLFGAIIVVSIMLRDEVRRIHLPKLGWYPFILILTWLIIGNLAYSLCVRFALLAIPPLIILIGLLFGIMNSYLKHPSRRLNPRFKETFIILLILLSVVSFVQSSETRFEPILNDDIVLASSWIKNETAPSTVIISEWNYGFPLEAFSQRPTIIDGGTQVTARNYWVDHAFAINNETLSIGIFSMLSTTGDKPIELLENKTGNTQLTVTILDDILGVDKEKARRILKEKYNMDPIFTEKLLSYTHPRKKQPFIILTCDDMISVGHWCYYYGRWDFNKSKGPDSIYSLGSSNDTGKIRRYSNNVTLNLDTGGLWENKRPYNTLIKGKNSTRVIAGDKESNFTIIFLLDKNWAIITDKSFQDSLFVKLVILKEETEHFKPIYKNNSTIVWAVK